MKNYLLLFFFSSFMLASSAQSDSIGSYIILIAHDEGYVYYDSTDDLQYGAYTILETDQSEYPKLLSIKAKGASTSETVKFLYDIEKGVLKLEDLRALKGRKVLIRYVEHMGRHTIVNIRKIE